MPWWLKLNNYNVRLSSYSTSLYNYLGQQPRGASDAESISHTKTENEDKSQSRSEIPEDESNNYNSVTPDELCPTRTNDTIQTRQDQAANTLQSDFQEQGDKQKDFNQREEKFRQKIQNKSKQAEIKNDKPEQSEQSTENQKLQPKDAAEKNNNKNGIIDTPVQQKNDIDTQQTSHKNSSTNYLEEENPELKEEVTLLIKELQEKVKELEKEKEKVPSLENQLQNVTQKLTEKEKEKAELRKQVLELEQVNKQLETELNDINKDNKKVETAEIRRDASDLKIHFRSEYPNEPVKQTGDHAREDLIFYKHECEQLTEKHSQIVKANMKLQSDVAKERSWCKRLLEEKKVHLDKLCALEKEVNISDTVSRHASISLLL